MKQVIKKSLMKVPFFHSMIKRIEGKRRKYKLLNWEKNGGRIPPPHIVKQFTLRFFAKKFRLKILVETGTYYGDMVEAMKEDFDRIYSIELSKELYIKAKEKFKNERHVEIIHGDSGIELKDLVGTLHKPALFWLDGHYSGGETVKGKMTTPIYEELTHIFNSNQKGHVIIIDDARLFVSDPAYPSLEDLKDYIVGNAPDSRISIKNDTIQITNL